MPCRMIKILIDIGFVGDYRPGSVHLNYKFDNQIISAIESCDMYSRAGVLIFGHISVPGTSQMIEYWLPVEVESPEEALAWISYVLRDLPRSVKAPSWISEGKTYWHMLPWERERAAYEARPQCRAQRDWVRVGLKSLANRLEGAADNTLVRFAFNGEILTIRVDSDVIAFPASGQRWTQEYQVLASNLRTSLPKRLMYRELTFHVWQGHFKIDGRGYPCVYLVAESTDEAMPQNIPVH